MRRYNLEMKSVVARLAVLGSLLVSGCASMGAATADDIITVARRPWFQVCAGVCPNYDVTVWPDGRVSAVRHNWGAPDEVERFRVSPESATDFRRILAPYKPAGGAGDAPVCKHDVLSEEASLVRKVTKIEVTWIGSRNPARLVACDGKGSAGLTEAIRQALWSVNLYVGGERRD